MGRLHRGDVDLAWEVFANWMHQGMGYYFYFLLFFLLLMPVAYLLTVVGHRPAGRVGMRALGEGHDRRRGASSLPTPTPWAASGVCRPRRSCSRICQTVVG